MRLLARQTRQSFWAPSSRLQESGSILHLCVVQSRVATGRRAIQIQAAPSTSSSQITVGGDSTAVSSPDATFEVLGSPYSLLSVTLSPSQELHTRRGTLVGLSGNSGPSGNDDDSTISTLRMLSPLRRALVGIPFLYQRITSTTPINALISTKSPLTSFAILQLDGTTDWKIAQRKALLAWTGQTLSVTPSINTKLSLAHWGSSSVTGRGLLGLAGQGQIFSLELKPGEEYIAHPSNVLAYSISSSSSATPPPPRPFRFKSSPLRLQIPIVFGNFFPSSKFVANMKASDTYKRLAGIFYSIRTWSRRTVWGDRLFLRFTGPTTLLLQSRAARVSDVLTARDVNELADAPTGAVAEAVKLNLDGGSADGAASPSTSQRSAPTLSVASVSRQDGKVKIESTESFEPLKKQ